jgi:ABC-type uncharacterized transport system substrate-binding protein
MYLACAERLAMNMSISRRKMCVSLAAASAGFLTRLRASVNRFVIVTASHESPHTSAIEGLQQALAARGTATVLLRLPADDAALRQELESGLNQCAVAVGTDAVRAVMSQKRRTPLIATMAFRGDLDNLRSQDSGENRLAGVVWLDMPLAQMLAGLRAIFPGAARLGIVNPSQQIAGELASPSHQLPPGMSVRPVPCGSASELLDSMRKLRGQMEFLICQPDSNIFNKTTVEPLILASLEHKLPLVGFSASFARAGAAIGVYPDFNDLGRQTASLSERCLGSPAGSREEYPRKATVAVNERVLHLLGRDYRPKLNDDVVVIR